MIQTIDRPALNVSFTPMDVPLVQPWVGEDVPGLVVNAPTVLNPLVLHPGEATEASVNIENLSDRTLDLVIKVGGTFPLRWCQVLRAEQTLPPGERLDSVLLFQVPDDFFEQMPARQPSETDHLSLNHQGHLQVLSRDPGGKTHLLRNLEFTLYLRPRSLYLDFLPSFYREIDFFSRLLKIFEMAFEPDVRALDTLWAYLNPRLAPRSMLPFLAHWVGWELLPDLSLEHQRDFIAQAMEIYRWRGTRRGLALSIHLVTGLPLDEPADNVDTPFSAIQIQDTFGAGLVLGDIELGEKATIGGSKPFHFQVVLRPPPHILLDEPLIRKTIEREKPAFCTYELKIMPTGATPKQNKAINHSTVNH